MAKPSFILATAGHVDHGKSALVRALTGTDPDRLPEEKARGITIELGFAHLELPDIDIGIVDVPGHEDFVKNMVAGVGSIDAALLIVAADDGWMPQSEEHLQILQYLGVTHAVVALTKIDLCGDVTAAQQSVREKLRDSLFVSAPIVPVSVVSSTGLANLKCAIGEMFFRIPAQEDIGKPRLAVDRVFALKGVGTIVTGTLAAGTISRDQNVIVAPSGVLARVRSIQTHNHDVPTAAPGSRVALNLPAVYPYAGRGSRKPGDIARGDVVTLPDLAVATDAWDVLIERSARADALQLKSGLRVQIHHGTAALAARLFMLDSTGIRPGGWAIAQLRFDQLVTAWIADRFVIRDWPEQRTLAGGVILDPFAKRHRWRSDSRRALLQARAANPADVRSYVTTQLKQDGWATYSTFLHHSRFGQNSIMAALDDFVTRNLAFKCGDHIADAAWWQAIYQRAIAAIDAVHSEHPERAGLAMSDLRAIIDEHAFNAIVDSLSRDGFVRTGAIIRRREFRPTLPPRLATAGEKLRAALAAHPFDPPSRKELTRDALSQQALKFLIINGEAVELGSEVAISHDAYLRAIAVITQHIRTHGPATVSDLKTAIGSSRRITVPLLEKLDRDNITLRQGDRRTIH